MNFHLASSQQNAHFDCKSITSRLDMQKPETASTSKRNVRRKNDIKITKTQRDWTAYLFRQYGIQVPGWLRTSFAINQRRRKLLNDIFRDANVDNGYCKQCVKQDDWSYHAHCVWHIVNEVSLCI